MYDQAIVFLSVVYGFFGLVAGAITASFIKSKIKKLGGAFLGLVGAIVSGTVVVITVSELKVKLSSQQSSLGGVSLNDLLPSLVAAIIGAIFLVYIIGLIVGDKKT